MEMIKPHAVGLVWGSVLSIAFNTAARRNPDARRLVAGTPLYMAPEMLSGEPYHLTSDIYSLGCVLYTLCMRRPPYVAKTLGALKVKAQP